MCGVIFKKHILLCVGFLELYGRHLVTGKEVFTLKAMGIEMLLRSH